jgi:hypothetical protein
MLVASLQPFQGGRMEFEEVKRRVEEVFPELIKILEEKHPELVPLYRARYEYVTDEHYSSIMRLHNAYEILKTYSILKH